MWRQALVAERYGLGLENLDGFYKLYEFIYAVGTTVKPTAAVALVIATTAQMLNVKQFYK